MFKLFFLGLLLSLAPLAAPHCKSSRLRILRRTLVNSSIYSPDTFPALVVNGVRTGDWVNVRMTNNHYDRSPVRLSPCRISDIYSGPG